MKLSQLRYFQAVCRTGSTSRAAEQLHISQPSVSSAIKELEQEFDVSLFSRESRSLQITEEGRILLSMADDLLERASQTEHTMRMLGKKQKVLRVGIPPMIASLLLPKIYALIRPHLQISITEKGREDLLEGLRKQQLDCAFLPYRDEQFASVSVLPFSSVETVFCVSEDHPFAYRTSIRFNELGNEKLILFQNEYFHTQMIREQLENSGSNAEIFFETSQLSTILSMIPGSSYSGFLFRPLAESAPGIFPVSMDPKLEIQIGLFRDSNSLITREMYQFIELLKPIRE